MAEAIGIALFFLGVVVLLGWRIGWISTRNARIRAEREADAARTKGEVPRGGRPSVDPWASLEPWCCGWTWLDGSCPNTVLGVHFCVRVADHPPTGHECACRVPAGRCSVRWDDDLHCDDGGDHKCVRQAPDHSTHLCPCLATADSNTFERDADAVLDSLFGGEPRTLREELIPVPEVYQGPVNQSPRRVCDGCLDALNAEKPQLVCRDCRPVLLGVSWGSAA